MSGRTAVGLLGLVLLGGAGPGGCPGDREVVVRKLGTGAQCGGEEGPRVRRVASAAELARLLSPGLGPAQPGPAVDWAREAVLLVGMGQRPTAGYGVELLSSAAPVKEGVAGVRVAFRSPAADALTAQVITSPCLFLALPREGLRGVAVLEGERVVGSVALE